MIKCDKTTTKLQKVCFLSLLLKVKFVKVKKTYKYQKNNPGSLRKENISFIKYKTNFCKKTFK